MVLAGKLEWAIFQSPITHERSNRTLQSFTNECPLPCGLKKSFPWKFPLGVKQCHILAQGLHILCGNCVNNHCMISRQLRSSFYIGTICRNIKYIVHIRRALPIYILSWIRYFIYSILYMFLLNTLHNNCQFVVSIVS